MYMERKRRNHNAVCRLSALEAKKRCPRPFEIGSRYMEAPFHELLPALVAWDILDTRRLVGADQDLLDIPVGAVYPHKATFPLAILRRALCAYMRGDSASRVVATMRDLVAALETDPESPNLPSRQGSGGFRECSDLLVVPNEPKHKMAV